MTDINIYFLIHGKIPSLYLHSHVKLIFSLKLLQNNRTVLINYSLGVICCSTCDNITIISFDYRNEEYNLE